MHPRTIDGVKLIARQIQKAHQLQWNSNHFPVDVVPYVNFGGGNTVLGRPPHTMISTVNGDRHPFEAVEILFHEASHTIIHPGSGGSIEAMQQAATLAGQTLHRDLWHGLLFYTAGYAAENAAREILNQEYRQYMYPAGLFTRAWPELQAPLETHWQAYLDGALTLEQAANRLVAAIDMP